MNNYYTYMYLREDGTPYYVGQGKGYRIHGKNKRRHHVELPPKDRRVFLKENLSKEESIQHEMDMIKFYGRLDNGTGILENRTDGGQGSSGRVLSEESREKIRNTLKGRKQPESVLEKKRGMKWWNNGTQEVRSPTQPEGGWNRGRLSSVMWKTHQHFM